MNFSKKSGVFSPENTAIKILHLKANTKGCGRDRTTC